jgi:hypothetical protein
MNRKRLSNNSHEKSIKDEMNCQSIQNDHHERTVINVTERNHNVMKTNRSVLDSILERENVSKEVTRRNEQNVKESIHNTHHLNQEKRNETANREKMGNN